MPPKPKPITSDRTPAAAIFPIFFNVISSGRLDHPWVKCSLVRLVPHRPNLPPNSNSIRIVDKRALLTGGQGFLGSTAAATAREGLPRRERSRAFRCDASAGGSQLNVELADWNVAAFRDGDQIRTRRRQG